MIKKLIIVAASMAMLAGCNQPYTQGNMSCKVKAGLGYVTCTGGPSSGTECLMTVQDRTGKVIYSHSFAKPNGAQCNSSYYN